MSDIDRRRFLSAAAATIAGGQLSLLAIHGRFGAMTGAMTETTMDAAPQASAGGPEIRPFHVTFPETELADLRRRIKATKWPEGEQVRDESQGVQLATMQ